MMFKNKFKIRILQLVVTIALLGGVIYFTIPKIKPSRPDEKKFPHVEVADSSRANLLKSIQGEIEQRQAALRYIHFKQECVTSYKPWFAPTIGGEPKIWVSPLPTKMEIWLDQSTGIHRAEYRPRVSRWVDGAAPEIIEESVQINDGRKKYIIDSSSRLDNLRELEPDDNLGYYLGGDENKKLAQVIGNLLFLEQHSSKIVPQSNFPVITIEKIEWKGHKAIQIQENIFFEMKGEKHSQQSIFILDQENHFAILFSELSFPLKNRISSQWTLVENGTTGRGIPYPRKYRVFHNFNPNGEETSDYTVISFEALDNLPEGALTPPKTWEELFLKK